MSNSIFRKESMDRITSPEQLDDYIRVTPPSIFLTMAAVIALLIGVCVWGIFGRLDTTLTVCAVNGADGLCCYVPEAQIGSLSADAVVKIGGEVFAIEEIAGRPAPAGELVSKYALHVGGLSGDQWVYEVRLNGAMGGVDDVYQTQIVLESVAPVSFILN